MNSFCVGGNLKTMIGGARCPNIIRKCKPYLEKVYSMNQRGTVMNNLLNLEHNLDPTSTETIEQVYKEKKEQTLDPKIQNALKAMYDREHHNEPVAKRVIIHHQSAMLRGLRYRGSPRAKEIVFFRSQHDQPLVPATIWQIFTIREAGSSHAVMLLGVERLKACNVYDPFARWKDFGAEIWGSECGVLEVIRGSGGIYPGNKRAWSEGCWVVRPLDRVSNSFEQASNDINVTQDF